MKYKKRRCIICQKEFDYIEKGGSRASITHSVRPHFSLTCSKKCSQIYSRVRIAIKQRELRKR